MIKDCFFQFVIPGEMKRAFTRRMAKVTGHKIATCVRAIMARMLLRSPRELSDLIDKGLQIYSKRPPEDTETEFFHLKLPVKLREAFIQLAQKRRLKAAECIRAGMMYVLVKSPRDLIAFIADGMKNEIDFMKLQPEDEANDEYFEELILRNSA